MPSQRHWWQKATIYEAYPASFKDSNGDGIGDLPGLISKVEHLAHLGVDAVWLAACYRSSGVDMGYDVVDYRDIDPQYGTVQDVEKLIAKLKEHGMRLIMDFVGNHTSDEHAWFKESRSSLKSPKRDWYFWRKGRVDARGKKLPPNNWESIFQGPAWEYDEATDEWYLRIFSKQQPDLNWDNPEVRKAIYGDMRFWLDKGVAGFRLDVINMISKPDGLPDAPVTDLKSSWQNATALYCNGPRVHEYIREMRKEALDPYGDEVMTVGEVICTEEPAEVRKFTDPERRELNMVYTYDLFGIDMGPAGKFTPRPWTLRDFKHDVCKWQDALAYSKGAWQTIWLESHDSARSVTRFGDNNPENRFKTAKLLALLQSTLAGTLFLYQGQEIGMQNLDPKIPLSSYPDVETQRTWGAILGTRAQEKGLPEEWIDMSDVLKEVHMKARDHNRAPLPWTPASPSDPHAGFSSAGARKVMWSPMNTDSAVCYIAQQTSDEDSVLKYWKHRLHLRKCFAETLVWGDFEPVETTMNDREIFAYWRRPLIGEERKVKGSGEGGASDVLVVLNLSGWEGVEFVMPRGAKREVVYYFVLDCTFETEGLGYSYKGCVGSGERVRLAGWQGVVFGF